jgi:parallel beta-helix repeat protein
MRNLTQSEWWNKCCSAIKISIFLTAMLMGHSAMSAIIYDKEHSPYYLNSNLIIAANDTLIILEGTTIIIDTAVDIIVNGTMIIKGTFEEPVNILPKVDTIGWGRIYLNKQGANCRFDHVKIVDGTVLSKDANLIYRNVHFINRQNLPLHFNITRVERASVDLQNCSIEGSGKGEGFLLMDMNKAIIKNCEFYNIPDAIEITKLTNSRISNNFFVDSPDDAIDLNNCTNVTVDSNIIIHAHDRGMEIGSEIFGSSINITVHRNLVIGCKEGIVFKEGSSGMIMNNTLYQNKIGIVCKEIGPTPGGSHITIENTIISQSVLGDIETDSLSEAIINYSLSDTEILDGLGNLFAEPEFIDPENDDFTLQESSPCIDAGNPASALDPDETISDMGAYFFNQDTTSSIVLTDSGIQSVKLFPNPFTSVLYVSYYLPQPSTVKIELFNVSGTKVKSIMNKHQLGGEYKIAVEINKVKHIETGLYVCIVSFNNIFKGFKVMHLK